MLGVFAIVLAIACFAGMYWGFYKNSAVLRGLYWLNKVHAVGEAPATVPGYTPSDAQVQSVHERCEEFEQKTRAGQSAQLELTADDINTLIAGNEDVRGKLFVSIDQNQLHCQASVPLGAFVGRTTYYFNGEIVFELKGPESMEDPQVSGITVKGEQVPKDLLNWKYRSKRLRDYLNDYRNDAGVGSLEIQDGKLIVKSRTE